ncbi:RNase adapter RapZ [Lutispora saccharofermentans]|uniref:RNase adapter RapZ n=1 Tax=Lutispora saccharofermentans TaxID=3024236 RepID=A0ABT1NJW1_9FIRM|nr:RNase adapter RapZ [Lutispora saccharofermentans]MCQ1531565.1 RNase adapter RapZ [Lutispora saccharofermentans]
MKFVIITGLSGAGKSQAVKFLEDLGFFCVDNLPPALISKFADICSQSRGSIEKIAIVTDIRGGKFFDQLQSSLDELEKGGFYYDILFLEASDETLIKRFKTSRRMHPLAGDGRIIRGIKAERKKLEEIKAKATYIIDTTNMSTSQLKQEIVHLFVEGGKNEKLIVNIISFGFKYGIPLDGDLVFDVRFLPNPYYIESMRRHSGHDEDVREYVMKWPEASVFMEKLLDMVEFLIPYYIKEGKSQLVIAIGCTGGRHRSVTISNLLSQKMREKDHRVIVEHRDIDEEGNC